jgi:DNA-binding NarL/FixJ family response regulator
MKPIRVLVVDDSATMRSLIREMLLRDPAIEVAGEAGDALEARAAIKALNPDVITLDVEMPKMSGLEFLDKIMRLRPAPVIMVSSVTASGASAAIKALETRPAAPEAPAPAKLHYPLRLIIARMAAWWPSARRPAVLRRLPRSCPSFLKTVRQQLSRNTCLLCSQRALPNAWIAAAGQM